MPSSTRLQAAPGLPSMGSEPTPSGEGPTDPAPRPFAGRREQGGPAGTVPPPPCPFSRASRLVVRSSSCRCRLPPGLLGLVTIGGSRFRAVRSGVYIQGLTRQARLCLRTRESAPIVEPPACRCRPGPRAGAASGAHTSPALRARGPMKTLTRDLRVPDHKPNS